MPRTIVFDPARKASMDIETNDAVELQQQFKTAGQYLWIIYFN